MAALTPAQLATLKADILADPVLNAQPNNSDGALAIAAAYNLDAAPAFWVWLTILSKNDITQKTSVDGTVFNWTGAGFITRSAGEQAAWRELFDQGVVNPSLPNVRQAFQDIFSGSGVAQANRTHLLSVARRRATRGEKLFATGTGSTASPAVMVVEGEIARQDVESARNLP